VLILAITSFSVIVTWPGNPDRYLPNFIPWPSGHGLNIGNFDRDEFRLGLDLAGGVSVTLEAAGESVPVHTGESLNEFVARTGIDISTVLALNSGLAQLDPAQYPQPLPDEFDILVLPLDVDDDFLADAIGEARLIIEERVNGFGVSEAEVTLVGSSRINAQIPGVTAAQAAELVGATALLEFREIDPLVPFTPPPVDPLAVSALLDDAFDPLLSSATSLEAPRFVDYPVVDQDVDVIDVNGTRWIPARGRSGEQLTGRFLIANSISRTFDQTGQPALAFSFNDDGADLMEEITSRLFSSQSPLGIFVDGRLISSPSVNAVISENGIISGLTDEQSRTLRRQLRAGALPINFEIIQQTEVAATLGEDSVTDTVQAGLVAFLAVALFMIVYYRLPGLLAVLALFVYAAVVMTTFKLVPVTLTLAGIAGFILSVGLAVDANILIFERMKEELRLGRSMQGSIDAGWARAWPAIRDANVSTLITVAILWFFADQLNANLIKSFAIALLIGTLLSMASAIFVTRTFLNLTVGLGLTRRPWLFGIHQMPADDPVVDQRPRRSGGSTSQRGSGD
jgi:preprotein translocase subunit SecD